MKSFCILMLSGIVIITRCTTSNTKIKSFPGHVGYRMHEKIVMTPITGMREQDNERLMRWTNALIQAERIFFKAVWYYDAVYQAKQQGMAFRFRSATLQRFILCTHVLPSITL